MDHAVDFAVEANEQTELGDVLDVALDLRADGESLEERFPGVVMALLEAERDSPLVGIDLEDHDLDLLAGRDDLAGMDVFLGPAHFGNMDQPLDTGLELDEGAVVGNVRHPAGKPRADGIFEIDTFPRIRLELLHAEGNSLGLGVVSDDLNLNGLADGQGFARMIDAPPRDIGDVQKAVDTAEIDESTVLGDVLHHALEDLAFLEVGEQLGAGLGARFLENGAPGNDDIAAPAVHLEDLERLGRAHQRADIAHRTNVDLASGQERDGAGEVDGEAALNASEDGSGHSSVIGEGAFELGPGFLAAGTLAAENGLAVPIFHAFEVDLDAIAGLDFRFLPGRGEFLQCDSSFGLEAHID